MKAPVKKASVKKKTATKKTAGRSTPARKPAAWPPSIGQIRAELVDVLLEVAFDPQTPAAPRVEAASLVIEAADRARELELLAKIDRDNADIGRRLAILEGRKAARA